MASHPLQYASLSKKEISYFLSFSLSFIFSTFSILLFDSFFPIIYYYQSKIYFIFITLICIAFILVLQHVISTNWCLQIYGNIDRSVFLSFMCFAYTLLVCYALSTLYVLLAYYVLPILYALLALYILDLTPL